MTRAATVFLAILLGQAMMIVPRARAEIVPSRGRVDSRIRTAIYDTDQVYRLHGFVGYQIDLEFDSDESFIGLGAGDIDGIAYVGEGNHLFLKPKASRVATNLTVLTTRRQYQLEYTAVSQKPMPGDPDVIFALHFAYPVTPSVLESAAASRAVDSQLDQASAQRRRNLDYWFCGSPTLRPIAMSDDGVHTRLRFAPNAELPAIFVRAEDNRESLLNFSMEGGDVIVHRVARRFVLRRGDLVGCVVNKGFAGGGIRLESGTVAPSVERRVLGGAP